MNKNSLKEHFEKARNKYRPANIKVLLIAEAPPESLDRFFYFENVRTQDSLFLEIIGCLYPVLKSKYIDSGRPVSLKTEMLNKFKSDGFWLLDLSDLPKGQLNLPVENCAPDLLIKLNKYIDFKTPVILIKANVYDCLYPLLKDDGYNVSKQRLPFPGSGQQKTFREKFITALDTFKITSL